MTHTKKGGAFVSYEYLEDKPPMFPRKFTSHPLQSLWPLGMSWFWRSRLDPLTFAIVNLAQLQVGKTLKDTSLQNPYTFLSDSVSSPSWWDNDTASYIFLLFANEEFSRFARKVTQGPLPASYDLPSLDGNLGTTFEVGRFNEINIESPTSNRSYGYVDKDSQDAVEWMRIPTQTDHVLPRFPRTCVQGATVLWP